MPIFQISGHTFAIERADVEAAAANELPEPIHEHYVIVGSRRYPPKQVLTKVTGLDRADFTTHHARRVLKRLGFVAARTGAGRPGVRGEEAAATGEQARALAPYVGKWVALAGPSDVLVAADTPQEVLAWLSKHDRRAPYGMFRVPESADAAAGSAPL